MSPGRGVGCRSARSLGEQWSLPLELGKSSPRSVVDTARLILEIVPGERPMLPGFGWRAHLLPLSDEAATDTSTFRGLVALLAEEALVDWAPDLDLREVQVLEVSGRKVGLRLTVGDETHDLDVSLRSGGVP